VNLPPGHIPPEDDSDLEPLKARDVYLLSRRPDLEVPENRSRICPQCGHETWAETRWCKHCVYDFDRAAIKRCHPVKLLWFFGGVMLVQSLVILYLALNR
jgi:hypothetical protein